MLKIAVCDDEQLYLEKTRAMLEQYAEGGRGCGGLQKTGIKQQVRKPLRRKGLRDFGGLWRP